MSAAAKHTPVLVQLTSRAPPPTVAGAGDAAHDDPFHPNVCVPTPTATHSDTDTHATAPSAAPVVPVDPGG